MEKPKAKSERKEMKSTAMADASEDPKKAVAPPPPSSTPQKNGVEEKGVSKKADKSSPAKQPKQPPPPKQQQQKERSDSLREMDSSKDEEDREDVSDKDESEAEEEEGGGGKGAGEDVSEEEGVETSAKDGPPDEDDLNDEDQKEEAESSDEEEDDGKNNDGSKLDEEEEEEGENEGGDSSKESDSADKTENGLENGTKKPDESKSSGQTPAVAAAVSSQPPPIKQEKGVAPLQQSSLLLAKLASQEHRKNSPTTVGSAGNSRSSSLSTLSLLKSNNPNASGSPKAPSLMPNKSYYSQSLSFIDDDAKMPTTSLQQIEAIKNETLLHSMSIKAQRILKAKAKAELLKKVDEKLGPLANFLNNLGLDIVKQSVYHEAIHIQSRKQQTGKLSDIECSQLDKMRSSCKELAEKLKHLKLSYRKCKLCNYVSESVNVHFMHREHPHINKREDFCCSYCAFNTRNNVAFNFHMEAEHNIKGRSMDKPSFWQCTLCPFEHNSKSKLTQHKFKCEKSFEIKTHLSPSPDTDINYSLYGVFYLSEKEEALKAIAIHKAKQAQLKAQQAQFKLQQQQAATNRANYFNANKISPIQPKQPMGSQRIPVVVHPKGGGAASLHAQISASQSNRFQTRQSNIPIKSYGQTLSQNSNRLQNKGGNLNLMRSQLPVKDLINIHQAIKGQSVMTAKSMASQKLIPSNTQSDVSEFEICELCGGYVKDRDALRIHFFYAHRVEMPALMFEKPSPPLFCDVCDKKFWTSQGLQKHRVSLKHYAKGSLSQVCILCGCLVSHLLNHMTDTHQLNLQDFLNQKRCIVCGKVCLSRSETEIHMAASHGILVKRTNANNSSDAKTKTEEKTPSSGGAGGGGAGGGSSTPVTMVTKSGQATSGSSASQLVKGNYCVFCKVPFASNAELTQHCLLVHKACKKCGMVLPGEGSLGGHKCQISIPTVKACSVCKQEILIQEFIKHVEEKHLRKCSIKLKRLNPDDIDNDNVLDSPCASNNDEAKGFVEKAQKRKAEDPDLGGKKQRKIVEESAKSEEAISISDSEDDDEEEEHDEETRRTGTSASSPKKAKKSSDANIEKGKDVKKEEAKCTKSVSSTKPDSERDRRTDNTNTKGSSE